MTRIRERRFQITLWTCEDDFSKDKEYICELYSCQLTFQMSSIPQATIKPLFGTIINSPEEAGKQSTSFEKLLSLAKDRSAVRIVLKVTQSFSSDNNEPDSYEWEFSGKGEPDEYGQYDSKPITIFEGFICPPSAEVTAVSSGITLTIQHWLSALANVSLLTTACHTSTPMELAIQCYSTLALTSPNDKSKWMPVNPKVDSAKGVWKYGIKELFLHVLNATKGKTLNRFAKRQRDRIMTALTRIKGDALVFRDIEGGNTAISILLDQYFQTEVYQTFIHTSAWDKLIGYYAPNFLFSLSPRVKDALLIPTPCAIDPKKVVELKDEDILQISSSPLSTSQLSRLYCVAPMGPNKAAADDGRTSLFPAAWYPEYEDEEKLQDGYIRSIAYPEWLTGDIVYAVPKVSDMLTIFKSVEDLHEMQKTSKKNAEDAGTKKKAIRKNLGQAYTQVSYLIQALNSTWACVVTPGRMDICVGTAVHCLVHGNTTTELDLYGTVSSETIRITAGKSTPTTQLTLTNIRTNKTINDEINNPSVRPLGYYVKEWDGVGKKLYD